MKTRSWYVCCAGHDLQTVGVLFPSVHRVFYLTGMQRHLAQSVCTNLMPRIMLYLARSGRLLPDYFARRLDGFATPLWGGGSVSRRTSFVERAFGTDGGGQFRPGERLPVGDRSGPAVATAKPTGRSARSSRNSRDRSSEAWNRMPTWLNSAAQEVFRSSEPPAAMSRSLCATASTLSFERAAASTTNGLWRAA